MFKLQGTLKSVGEEVQVSDKFKKREFVLSYMNGNYEQIIQFQLVQDKTDLIEPYAEGSEIEVSFNLNGREWTNPQGEVKVFNTLDAWRVENVGGNAESQHKPAESKPKSAQPESADNEEDDDDLPF